uniref:Uncharacterized protein n=1 Tax=Amphiprion percula TaxID=161767 RepID=A0A3P8RWD1_AMPPE
MEQRKQKRLSLKWKPRVTTEGLQESLDLVNFSFPESLQITMEGCMQHVSLQDTTEETSVLQKPLIAHLMFAKEHPDTSQWYWENLPLWTSTCG